MIAIQFKRNQQLADSQWRRLGNNPKTAGSEDYWPCFICSRPVHKNRARWIHVINGGGHAAEEGDVIEAAGDMGGHPCGLDCLRAQPDLRRVSHTKTEY